MIDKNKIIEFVESLLSEKESLSFIDDNEENFNKFKMEYANVKEALAKDANFFFESDPAANSIDEIKLTYPGYKAISYYRIAHILFSLGYKLEARIVTEQAHFLTGIDIHPAAVIGTPFFIDHGTGVVIGETSIIGKNCRLYQSVTLGALSPAKGQSIKGVKRHPSIGNNVIIYSGASIIGDITIGNNVTIGCNVFLLDSIPDNYKVTISKPELVIREKTRK